MHRWPALLLSLAVALPALAAQPAVRGVRIAVSEPVVHGTDDPEALSALAEVIASELAHAPDVSVITPSDIRNLLGLEANRQLLGCESEDAGCLTEIGGALGVDYVLGSRVTRIGGSWLVSLTLIDVAAARSVERVALETPESRLVQTAREAASQVRRALKPEATPAAGGGLRWIGAGAGGAALLAGGLLYGSAWTIHGDHQDGQAGEPLVTWPEAKAAEARAGWGVGLMTAGAAMALASVLFLGPSSPGPPSPVVLAPAPGGVVLTLELP